MNRFYLGAWALFIVLIPFYLMGKVPVPKHQITAATVLNQGTGPKVESGVPQLSDYLMLVLMVSVAGGIGIRFLRSHEPVVRAFAGFVVYATLINLFWSVWTLDWSCCQYTLFYAYDVPLFATFLVLYNKFKDKLLWVTVHALAASVFLQVIVSPFVHEASWGDRQPIFFNSPNQLGHFTVLAAILFSVGGRYFRLNPWYQVCYYTSLAYLVYVSQCRAGILALGLLTILSLMERPLRLALGLISIGAAYLIIGFASTGAEHTTERLFRFSGKFDTPEKRGYDRIANHPQYLFLGAGEGAYDRFESELYGSELHSSFGTLLFCYGIPGTILFGRALFLIFARAGLRSALLLLPAFLFGLTHQGLRFSLFWVLLAFLLCVGNGLSRSGSTSGHEPSPAWQGV
jgi:hypothetical protein